jgi:hypothetical protein
LIQKSKGRRKNMPRKKRAAKKVEKSCILKKRKRNFIYKNQKNYKLKDQNQK